MIRNEVKLIGRLTADPELKYTKKTNKALCNVVLAVNSIYSNEAEYLHLVFWNKTAENLCKYKGSKLGEEYIACAEELTKRIGV